METMWLHVQEPHKRISSMLVEEQRVILLDKWGGVQYGNFVAALVATKPTNHEGLSMLPVNSQGE